MLALVTNFTSWLRAWFFDLVEHVLSKGKKLLIELLGQLILDILNKCSNFDLSVSYTVINQFTKFKNCLPASVKTFIDSANVTFLSTYLVFVSTYLVFSIFEVFLDGIKSFLRFCIVA